MPLEQIFGSKRDIFIQECRHNGVSEVDLQIIVFNRIADALTFALKLFENREDGEDANESSYSYPEELIYELTSKEISITEYYLNKINGLKNGDYLIDKLIEEAVIYTNFIE